MSALPDALYSRLQVNEAAPKGRPDTGGADSDATPTLRRRRSFRERLATVMRDLRHEAAVAYPELAAWVDFLDVEGKSPKTLYDYTRELALLLRENPNTPFDQFTPEQINAALALKPARSRYITRSVFNGWFGWGVEQDKLDRSPMRKVAKPKHPHRRPKDIYSEDEIELLEALPIPDGQLCTLMFTSGIRKGEARNLCRNRIDLDRARMVVINGKGGKDRIIPLPPMALKAIADLDLFGGLRPENYLWYTRPGGTDRMMRNKPISDTTMDRWWDRTCAKAGVRRLNMHQTRHTYGQRLREKGFDIELRQVLMGHEDIRTTEHYYGRVTIEDAAVRVAAWS